MIRRLMKAEHEKTRKLWEEVFDEDSREFLDYYYSVKTAENEIYVVEMDEDIRAMLQCNPYKLAAEEKVTSSYYIVGVATEKDYRGRGYMAGLLRRSLEDMYKEGVPFAFLMPAAEAIYYPHGFRFIYRQKRCRIAGKKEDFPEGVTCRKAEETDCRALGSFAEEYLKERYAVRTKRNEAYYRMMLKEQRSEQGGILILEQAGEIIGCLFYAEEGDYMEVREPLLPSTAAPLLGRMVYALTGDEERMISCQAMEEEMLSEKYARWEILPEKPVIMARIVEFGAFLGCFRARRDFRLKLTVQDTLLEENCGVWKIEGKKGENLLAEKSREERHEEASGKADPVTVEEIISLLSGYVKSQPENELDDLFAGIECWDQVFLNEIV